MKPTTSSASETERQLMQSSERNSNPIQRRTKYEIKVIALENEPSIVILYFHYRRKYYFGDLGSDDFATPRKAERYFGIARDQISKQRRKIIHLQQLNRRLRGRLTNIHSLVELLKDKNLLNESSQDTITVSLYT